jgi:murein DD-endopeptidase MepM/ murein hydrolase activator NlpD
MDKHHFLAQYIQQHTVKVSKVVDFNPQTDKLYKFDFTVSNTELANVDVANTAVFSRWVIEKLQQCSCKYGIGGYMEHRTLYARSELFGSSEASHTPDEPRRLHLGVDIWGQAETPVYAPLGGIVHSFRDNNHFGDYGPTIILEHTLEGLKLYSLYGHLTRESLEGLYQGKLINAGDQIAGFGNEHVNGNWPPHLHFQLMFDMEGWEGDYPGVGRYSQEAVLKLNIPDPNIILRFPDTTIM